MTGTTKRRPLPAVVLMFLLVFLGVNGIAGGGAFLLAPDGRLLQMPISQLRNSPFSDFTIPGLLLGIFLGVYPLVAAYCLWARPAWRWPEAINPFKGTHWAWPGSIAAGVIAMIWIAVQVQWIEPWPLHTFIFAWGALIVLTALIPGVRKAYVLAA